MPMLFGRHYTKKELLEKVGDISQLGGARHVRLAGGMREGVEAVQFFTGSGLSFLAVPGRGMDITRAEHNGRALAWISGAGEMAAPFYEPEALGWLRTFAGGLITTCGLTNIGNPCEDDGESLGLHGRISNIAASNVHVDGKWEGDEYRMWISGKMRQSRLFGENLLLERRISALLGQNKLWVDDIVTNEGSRSVPHMILYHINSGFPVVDEGSLFVSSSKHAKPRDAEADAYKDRFNVCEPPAPNFKERCYYHDMAADAGGFARAAVINKNLSLGLAVKYSKSELPEFVQWKMNGTREYVVGLEPTNGRVDGRDKARASGRLQFLDPGESREYHLEISVLATADEIAEFESRVAG